MSTIIKCPKCGQPAAYVNGRVHCKTCPDPAPVATPAPAPRKPARPALPAQPAPFMPVQQSAPLIPAPQFEPAQPGPPPRFPNRMTFVLDAPFAVGFKFGLGLCCAGLVFSIIYAFVWTLLIALFFAMGLFSLIGIGAAGAAASH